MDTRRLGREGFDKHKATDLKPDFARKNDKGFVSAQDRISEKWETLEKSRGTQKQYTTERDARTTNTEKLATLYVKISLPTGQYFHMIGALACPGSLSMSSDMDIYEYGLADYAKANWK